MAYQQLMTARSDYSNFGSMLASAQENVADTNAQNTESTQFYDSYKAQLEGTGLMEGLPAIPLAVENAYAIGKNLYGAYQKSKDLIPRIKDAANKLQTIGEEAIATGKGQLAKGVDLAKNTADTLNNQVLDLGNTVTEGGQNLLSSAQDIASNVENVARSGINDVMSSAQNEASNILQTARETGQNIVNVAQEQGANAISSLSDVGKQAIDTAMTTGSNILNTGSQNSTFASIDKIQSDFEKNYDPNVPYKPTPFEKPDFLNPGEFGTVRERLINLAGTNQNRINLISEAPVGDIFQKSKLIQGNIEAGLTPFSGKPIRPAEPAVTTEPSATVTEPAATLSESVAPSEAGISNNIRKAYTAYSGKAETYQSFSTTKGRGLASSQANAEATSGEFSSEALEPGDLIHSYASLTQNINPRSVGESMFGKIKNMFSKAPEVKTTGFNAPDINATVETAARDITSNISGAASQTVNNITEGARQAVSNISENVSGGIKSATEGVGRTAGEISNAVETTKSAVTEGVSNISEQASTLAENVVGKVGGLGETVSGAIGGATSLAAETGEKAVGLLSAAADVTIPVVGEIGMLGLGIYQGIKGFEDLFKHPSQPTLQATPQVANIAQSFQSGI